MIYVNNISSLKPIQGQEWECIHRTGVSASLTATRRLGTLLFSELHTSTAAAAKLLQSCPTLCNPVDGSPPGYPAPGILQARTLEWVAISFSSTWKWKVKVKSLSRVWLLATPWTIAHQAPPSMGFSRQEYQSGLLLPSLELHTEWPKNKRWFVGLKSSWFPF